MAEPGPDQAPTKRFSDRVADYARYRPDYPPAALDALEAAGALAPGAAVADVGAGTGILTRQLLDRGARVVAVEPNGAMRRALAEALGHRAGLTVDGGAAEATGLGDATVDLVAAAQAFHWFDQEAARREFQRVLKPGGQVALLWNVRDVDASSFMRDYEAVLRRVGTDYDAVAHWGATAEELRAFFGGDHYRAQAFPHRQVFHWEGLRGRCFSSSYVPGPGHPGHGRAEAALREVFLAHAREDCVEFVYETRLYHGRLR